MRRFPVLVCTFFALFSVRIPVQVLAPPPGAAAALFGQAILTPPSPFCTFAEPFATKAPLKWLFFGGGELRVLKIASLPCGVPAEPVATRRKKDVLPAASPEPSA